MGKPCCQTPEPNQSAHDNPRWRLILCVALAPIGNTSRANVSAFGRMEIPPDLRDILDPATG